MTNFKTKLSAAFVLANLALISTATVVAAAPHYPT